MVIEEKMKNFIIYTYEIIAGLIYWLIVNPLKNLLEKER